MSAYRTRSQLLKVKSWAALVECVESAPRRTGDVSHYFEAATNNSWGTIWHDAVVTTPNLADSALYFVESSDDMIGDGTRVYLVKTCTPAGIVDTLSEWPHYLTEDEAIAARNFVAGVA